MKIELEVENNSYGYDIRIENVTISKDNTKNKTNYYVDGVYYEEFPEIEDRKTRDLLQVAYLIYRQKEAVIKEEISKIIEEILEM